MSAHRSILTAAVVVTVLASLTVPSAAAPQVPMDQLPADWARLLPTAEQVKAEVPFPMYGQGPNRAPADDWPWTMPGRPVVEAQDPRVSANDAAADIEDVIRTYEIREDATYKANNMEFMLWRATMDIRIRRHWTEDEARQAVPDPFNANAVPADATGVSGRRGPMVFHVSLDLSRDTQAFSTADYKPMREAMLAVAADIDGRLMSGPVPARVIGGGQPVQTGPQTGGQQTAPDAVPPAIEVRAEMPGYAPQTKQVQVPAGTNPGQIIVRVTTTHQVQGAQQPLQGVSVSLPQHGTAGTTSAQGTALLTGLGQGQDPVDLSVNLTMQRQTTGLELLVRGPDLFPIGGGQDVQVVVRDATTHTPIDGAMVKLTLPDATRLPFVALQQPATGGPMAQNAWFTRTITVNQPTSQMVQSVALQLPTMPLQVRVKAEAWLENQPNVRGETEWSAPMDLLMLKGLTVGPDMTPRNEARAPMVLDSSAPKPYLAGGLHPTEAGRFYVLLRASALDMQAGTLAWPGECRLSLQIPLKKIPDRFGGGTPTAGSTVDIGMFDVLTPAEHVTRIKSWVDGFLDAMQFDNGQLGSAKSALTNLPVTYSAGAADQPPAYGNGRVTIYQGDQEWWGQKAFLSEDPVYAIMFHELGHMVYREMVDGWRSVALCDKWFIGGGHSTWRTPDASTETGKEMTAYEEALADFCAYTVYEYLDRTNPQFRANSIYHDRGYLAEFSTESRALASLGAGGWKVEGVQTTFWRDFYQQWFTSDTQGPAAAFGDVLRTADQWKNESTIFAWVPARTVREWIAMKRKLTTQVTAKSQLEAAVTKYGLDAPGSISRVMVPTGPQVRKTRVSVAGVQHTLRGDTFAVALPVGDAVEMIEGQGLMMVETIGQPDAWRRVYVDQGTKCVFETADRLRVDAGRVIVDGVMSITHGNVTVTPRGTTVVVEVGQGGTTSVTVAEGSAQVQSPGGNTTLSVGQALTVAADGSLGQPSAVNAAQAVSAIIAGTGGPIASGGTGAGGQETGGQETGGQETGGQETGGQETGGQETGGPQSMPLAQDSAVKQAIICTGLSDRGKPLNVKDAYPADTEKLALYLQIEGAPPNTEIELKWQRDGKIIGRSLLLVAGDKKSLSYLYAKNRETLWSGRYALEIEENDRLVGRLIFTIGPQ